MEVKKVEIICLDKPRTLVMDLNALSEAGKVTGRNYFDMKDKQLGPEDVRALLWAGLKHEDPNLKLEDVDLSATESHRQETRKGQEGRGCCQRRPEQGWVLLSLSGIRNEAEDAKEDRQSYRTNESPPLASAGVRCNTRESRQSFRAEVGQEDYTPGEIEVIANFY